MWTRWGIMDEITLGGRVEFVTWIRVKGEIILYYIGKAIWHRNFIVFRKETFYNGNSQEEKIEKNLAYYSRI